MLFAAAVALACAGAAWAATVPSLPDKVYYDLENAENLFKEFVIEHKKNYHNLNEYLERLEIFKQTLKELNELNSAWPNTVFGVNKFSDLTPNEKKKFLGHKPLSESDIERIDLNLDAGMVDPLPAAFDWRDKHVVTPVKDQAPCESCYIFSAIANIEGQYALKHNQCVSFSEQQVMDCMPGADCEDGGFEHEVMRYLAESGYPCQTESDYPYVGPGQNCAADKNKGLALVEAGNIINMTDENALAQALVQMGPLSVAVYANPLFSYKGGIVSAAKCGDEYTNHAVLLVGYGTEEKTNTPFWIIKNSWGKSFGEQGYFRLERGANACRILSYICSAEVA